MIPLVFFAIGIVAAEIIRTKFQRVQQIHWRQLVLIIESLEPYMYSELYYKNLLQIKNGIGKIQLCYYLIKQLS